MDSYNSARDVGNWYGGATMSSPQGAVVEASSPLRDAISVTEQQEQSLHQAISDLEQRLDGILMPVPPSPVDKVGGSTPTPSMSHVRERVGKINAGYMHAIDRLNELRRRVDL